MPSWQLPRGHIRSIWKWREADTFARPSPDAGWQLPFGSVLTDPSGYDGTDVMGQGKQAKVLTETQIKAVLAAVDGRRYPKRDRVMVLLSIRAGLRAKEIAMARWSMVTDAEGNVGDALHLPNKASKGKNGGRTVWLRAELRDALVALQAGTHPTILSTASAMPA